MWRVFCRYRQKTNSRGINYEGNNTNIKGGVYD